MICINTIFFLFIIGIIKLIALLQWIFVLVFYFFISGGLGLIKRIGGGLLFFDYHSK